MKSFLYAVSMLLVVTGVIVLVYAQADPPRQAGDGRVAFQLTNDVDVVGLVAGGTMTLIGLLVAFGNMALLKRSQAITNN